METRYCVAVTQVDGFYTYAFCRPRDLIRFLQHPWHGSIRIVSVNRVFEVLFQPAMRLGTLSVD